MKLKVNVKLLNSDFSQSIADDFYKGDESEENVKYLWEDELIIDGLENFSVNNNNSYPLNYAINNQTKEYRVDKCSILMCTKKTEEVQLVFSRSIIKSTEKLNKENGDIHFNIILKDTVSFYNPVDGIYIAAENFPTELKATTNLLGLNNEHEEE